MAMKPLHRTIFVWILALGFSAALSAQSVPVYVSGGPNIYKISVGAVSLIFTYAGANFESIAVGPDNVDTNSSGNAVHPFLLYACDTAGNRIFRFDPASTPITPETVYSGTITGLQPVCGRFSSAGDFYITNKSGPGVWVFSNVANLGLGTLGTPNPPVLVNLNPGVTFPSTMTGRGISQKNTGDLLVVDNADNQVLQSPYGTTPPFATLTTFTSTNLSAPVGIARFSTGEVFVANSALGKGKTSFPPVAHFERSGSGAATCPGLTYKSNQTPLYLAAAETDSLYLVSTSNSAGTLWNWSPAQGTCSLIAVATTTTPVSGVAVPPIHAAAQTQTLSATSTNPTPTTFNFNSHAFQITAGGPNCTGTVTPYPVSPATISGMINIAKNQGLLATTGQPAVNLGEGGFEIAYVAKLNGCTSVFSDQAFVNTIFGLYDNLIVSNPRMIRCDSPTEPLLDGNTTCQVDSSTQQLIGVYPLGGIIPTDTGTSIKTGGYSTFALVNEGLTAAEPGTFCGYQSPLINTTDPNQAAVFDPAVTNTIPVKFKLAYASPNGNCQNGPYITDATALLSVAQIADANGAPVFNAISIESTSTGLGDTQPLFNSGNQQYQFTLNIAGYAPGTYSMTVVFLSDNTTMQTIVFKIQ